MSDEMIGAIVAAIVAAIAGLFGGRYVRRRERSAAETGEIETRERELHLYDQRITRLVAEVKIGREENAQLRQEYEALKLQVRELQTSLAQRDRTHADEIHSLHISFEAMKQELITKHNEQVKDLLIALGEKQANG